MGYFDPIPNTVGTYTSHLELMITGSSCALISLRDKLTLHNLSVQQQIRRLKKTKPRSTKHLQMIQAQINDLRPKEKTLCYADTDEGVSVPPGCFFMAEKITNPEMILAPELDIKWLGHERHYQEAAVKNLLKLKRASVQVTTGGGKSLCIRVLTRTLVAAGERVLIVVPSTELLKQTFFPLKEDGTFTVTMLGDGNVPALGSDVVVSTMQSAATIADQFSVLITDECQHNSADTLQKVMTLSVNAKYVYGLSASPWRADGMTQLIWNFAGPIVYKYTGGQAIKEKFLVPLKYIQRPVPMMDTTHPNMQAIKRYIKLHMSDAYIDAAEAAARQALTKGRKVLVLFKSIDCCKKLGKRLGVASADGKYRAPFYAFKKGESDICIANISLLGEGIDVPSISAIIYCAGSVSEISTVQAFGRGTRKSEGKSDCVILDLFPALPDWTHKARIRERYYKAHFTDVDTQEEPYKFKLLD